MADDTDDLVERVTKRAQRRAQRRADRSPVWFGVSTFGIIGWSIAVPTLLGLALGVWLDKRLDGDVSWTIALLLAGLTLGCFNAWHWVSEQNVTEDDE